MKKNIITEMWQKYQFDTLSILMLIGILIQINYFNAENACSFFELLETNILGVIPGVVLYCFLRIFFRPLFCLLSVSVLVDSLAFINAKKIELTQFPLVWNDLINFSHFSLVLRYLNNSYLTASLIGLIFIVVLGWRSCSFKHDLYPLGCKLFLLSCLVIFSHWIFNPQLETFDAIRKNQLFSFSYFPWNLLRNVEKNGLLVHLYQTSFRKKIPKPNELTYKKFMSYSEKTESADAPHHIIYILCESCWQNKSYFNRAFKPLLDQGLIPFRAISPTYGGGTPNAEFEMYTSLPAVGYLSGIIYQEYSSLLSPKADTIINSMNNKGYHTIALHNNGKKFWRRDIVLNKLGFNHFIGIELMDEKNIEGDVNLFAKALEEFNKFKDVPTFFSLITLSTHGPYINNGDDGVMDYERKLQKSLAQMALFITKIKQVDPNVIIVVYGDHKPALNNFFTKLGILNVHNPDLSLLGDVPVLIYDANKKRLSSVINQSAHKPFYCVSAIIDHYVLHSGNPAANYIYKNSCPSNEKKDNIPSWLYYWSIFN